MSTATSSWTARTPPTATKQYSDYDEPQVSTDDGYTHHNDYHCVLLVNFVKHLAQAQKNSNPEIPIKLFIVT